MDQVYPERSLGRGGGGGGANPEKIPDNVFENPYHILVVKIHPPTTL